MSKTYVPFSAACHILHLYTGHPPSKKSAQQIDQQKLMGYLTGHGKIKMALDSEISTNQNNFILATTLFQS